MEIKTETFGVLTSKAFDASCKYLNTVSKRVAAEWRGAIIFGVAAVFKTGDVTHVNKLLPILVALGLEPMYRRVIVRNDLIPFRYNKQECLHYGTIDGGRRAALEIRVKGIPQWEIVLNAALNGETAEKAPAAFTLQTRLSGLIKKDRKQDKPHTDKEIRAMLTELLKEFPMPVADSTMLTAADQVRVKENKAKHNAKVKQAVAKAA